MASPQRARDPTPDEIAAECLIIRAGWSQLDQRLRRGHHDFVGFNGPGIREISTRDLPQWARDLITEEY
jgi:hypothetical protein